MTEFDNLWAAARFQPDSVAFQLLAYRYRLDRRFAEARNAIRTAIDLSPTISSQNITAGHIIFWEAIPQHLDPTPRVILPATFHRLFFRPTNLQIKLLNEAIESYDRAITQLSQFGAEEAQQIREIEGFRLLCLSYQSHRQPEAKQLALQLLRSDPTNFSALFYCMERGVEFNTNASVSALEERCANKCATLEEIYILTELYRGQDKSELAVELLRTEQERFTQAKARYLWTELMMELLAKRDPSVAIKLVQDYQSEDSILKNRLRAVLYDRVAHYSNLEQVGVRLWQISDDLLSPFQVEKIGISGARLFYLAEDSGGMVLAKHLGKTPETDNLLDDKLTTKRVFPREVLTALWRLGAVPQAKLYTLVNTHLDESCRDSIVDILLQRPSLVTDHLTLEHLAILGVLLPECLISQYLRATPNILGRVCERTIYDSPSPSGSMSFGATLVRGWVRITISHRSL